MHELLMDPENIGTLVICKTKQRIGPDGKRKVEEHPSRREIAGGIPAIIGVSIYERAQVKLKTNKADKGHLPLKQEDYLLRAHITCAACGCSMKPRTQMKGRHSENGNSKDYPFYKCTNLHNKYGACPARTAIRTSPLDEIVWQECCELFKRTEAVQAALEQELQAAVNALLEVTTGQEQIRDIEATIQLAEHERTNYAEGSYMYNLISQDILKQQEQLVRFQEEIGSVNVERIVGAYQRRILDFWSFLNVMRGRYEQATFQEKRNALEVLGVRVIVHDSIETHGLSADALDIGNAGQEWFSAKATARALGVNPKTIHFYRRNGTITNYKYEPYLQIHRDEIVKLQKKGFLQRNTEEVVRSRVDISYSPRFTVLGGGSGINLRAVPVSFTTRR